MSENTADRSKVIVKTSIIGIIANVFLAAFKAAVGILSNSIAVVLDAVNNLSDAMSSIVTIIGTRLGNKRPDKDHPLGHGRYEYLGALVVSALVLYAGITSLVESVKKIIEPEAADYSIPSLIIIASAVVVKLLLGSYVKKKGEEVNSQSLIASGSDARFDALISLSVLVSALIYLKFDISLEAYLGVIISVIIIKSGIEMLRDTLDDILGKRVDAEFTNEIKHFICEDEEVEGAYDLILHDYGPDRYVGSVHVGVRDTMSAEEIDMLERRIAEKVFERYGIIMTGIGIYSINTKNEEVVSMRDRISHCVLAHEGVLQMHGFFADLDKKVINLDIIIDMDRKDRKEIFEEIKKEVSEIYPDYCLNFTMDLDI